MVQVRQFISQYQHSVPYTNGKINDGHTQPNLRQQSCYSLLLLVTNQPSKHFCSTYATRQSGEQKHFYKPINQRQKRWNLRANIFTYLIKIVDNIRS